MPEADLSVVGDHFILGLQPTPDLSEKDRRLLQRLQPAGIVLFKGNFDQEAPYEVWLSRHERLIEDVREACGREKLLIGIDHEGGRVTRTPAPITRFAAAAEWGAAAENVGRAMGQELASLGINISYAPSLDVNSNAENPVIGVRSLGSDPHEVARLGSVYRKGLEAEGVIACPKHFPGHGDTSQDSHYQLPKVACDLETLHDRELVPFKRAISEGVTAIMTSHVMFPVLDETYPTTLSKAVVDGLLRKDLGFQGAVVSDDVGMHAMDTFFKDETSMVTFLEAGHDLLMLCSHWTETERTLTMAASLIAAQETPGFDETVLAPSRARVATLLSLARTNSVRPLSQETFERHSRVAALHHSETAVVV